MTNEDNGGVTPADRPTATGARAGRYLGNGQWSCCIPGQNRTVTHRQPGVSAQDVARGLATMGAIINLMQSRGGGGGGGGHRH
jgi:hypothetical protein